MQQIFTPGAKRRLTKLWYFISVVLLFFAVNKILISATTTATVSANIIIAMSLTTQNNMAFGDLSASSTAGSVILSIDGIRSSIGGTTINSAVPGNPAKFSAAGEPGAIYSITIPESVILTDSANNNMVVDTFISEPSENGQLDSGGNSTVIVGATLHVNSQQAFGSYTGLMALNVDYN